MHGKRWGEGRFHCLEKNGVTQPPKRNTLPGLKGTAHGLCGTVCRGRELVAERGVRPCESREDPWGSVPRNTATWMGLEQRENKRTGGLNAISFTQIKNSSMQNNAHLGGKNTHQKGFLSGAGNGSGCRDEGK